jgi:hypothetical protein
MQVTHTQFTEEEESSLRKGQKYNKPKSLAELLRNAITGKENSVKQVEEDNKNQLNISHHIFVILYKNKKNYKPHT